jgi:hypothetical protein
MHGSFGSRQLALAGALIVIAAAPHLQRRGIER